MGLGVITAALVMGLAGGPHCVAMCAAPCEGVVQGHQRAVLWRSRAAARPATARACGASAWQFHAGRMLGYAALGAMAAQAMASLAWWSSHTAALHSVWVLLHLGMLAWGLALLMQAQQPMWLERAGRAMWARIQPALAWRGAAVFAGALWVLMPCGLLYSALLVAALSGSAQTGALSMWAFAAGSALWLVLAPMLLRLVQTRWSGWHAQWGTRTAGALLVAMALWALWRHLVLMPAQWCR